MLVWLDKTSVMPQEDGPRTQWVGARWRVLGRCEAVRRGGTWLQGLRFRSERSNCFFMLGVLKDFTTGRQCRGGEEESKEQNRPE